MRVKEKNNEKRLGYKKKWTREKDKQEWKRVLTKSRVEGVKNVIWMGKNLNWTKAFIEWRVDEAREEQSVVNGYISWTMKNEREEVWS